MRLKLWQMKKFQKFTGTLAHMRVSMARSRNGGSRRLRTSPAGSLLTRWSENYDGAHLKTEKILNSVVSSFGRERVELVLAAPIQEKIYDGRFSNANKEWA